MITDEQFVERMALVDRLTDPGARLETEEHEVRGVVRRSYRRRADNLAAMFTDAVERNSGAVVLVDQDHARTFQELLDHALAIATNLYDSGVQRGDRVGILGANSIEWVEAFWACALAGFVSVPLNALWTRAELAYAIAHSEMVCCFVDAKRHSVVEGLVGDVALVPLEQLETIEQRSRFTGPGALGEDGLLSLFYTSGTTGRPKGAMIDHRGIIANLENLVYFTIRSRILKGTPRRSPDTPRKQRISLLAVPLFHVTGCHAAMVVSLVFGNQIVLYPPRAFVPVVAMEIMQRHKIDTLVCVPTLMARILDDPRFSEFDLSSLETVGFGGAPVSPDLARRTRSALGGLESFSNGYGLTETNAAVIGNYGIEYELRPDSVGKPAPNVDVAIVDEQSRAVRPGERGEILSGGPMLMAGYWRDSVATDAAIRDGWLHTEDVGLVDEDGYISVVDRIKDVVIRGGENVYSAEVEHVIQAHPDVIEAAVVGVAHPKLGEEVKAIVVSRTKVDVATLAEYCRGRLASFKVPVYREFLDDSLPRNAAEKVRKTNLRGV